MATTDLLHLLKRARGRYLDHVITPSVTNISETNYEKVMELLKLGPVLADKSQLGRMRDFYPLEMFTMENVITLLKKELFADAFYFTPFALMVIVIRVPFFRQDFRLNLLEVAYLMVREVYDDILRTQYRKGDDLNREEKVVQRARGDSDIVTFAECSALERMICTMCAYTAALQTHPTTLRTDALGTHIVEQKIGQARHGMDGRWTRILSVITQSLMRSVMLGIDKVEIHAPSRLKAAGCCLDGTGTFFIDEFNPSLVAKVMIHSVSEAARAATDFPESLRNVITWFQSIDQVLKDRSHEIGRVWMPSVTANSGIMARLLKTDISSIAP